MLGNQNALAEYVQSRAALATLLKRVGEDWKTLVGCAYIVKNYAEPEK
jgi:hypothetical protein